MQNHDDFDKKIAFQSKRQTNREEDTHADTRFLAPVTNDGDLDPVTLIYEPDLDTPKAFLNTKK